MTDAALPAVTEAGVPVRPRWVAAPALIVIAPEVPVLPVDEVAVKLPLPETPV